MARDKQGEENLQGVEADYPRGRKQELLAWRVVRHAGIIVRFPQNSLA